MAGYASQIWHAAQFDERGNVTVEYETDRANPETIDAVFPGAFTARSERERIIVAPDWERKEWFLAADRDMRIVNGTPKFAGAQYFLSEAGVYMTADAGVDGSAESPLRDYGPGCTFVGGAGVKRLEQSIDLKAVQTAGITELVLSGWAKIDAQNFDSALPEEAKFELKAVIAVKTGLVTTQILTRTVRFDARISGWQYGATLVSIPQDAQYLRISADASDCPYAAAFDRISLKAGSFRSSLYDGMGRIDRTKDSATRVSNAYCYDEDGKLTAVDGSLNHKTYRTSYEYDGDDRLVRTTDPKGVVTENEYDGEGRFVRQSVYHRDAPACAVVSQSEADEGRPVGTYNDFGEQIAAYEYSEDGRMRGVRSCDGTVIGYGYDAGGNLPLETAVQLDGVDNGNASGYTYGMPTRLSHNRFDFDYAYDGFGRVVGIKIGQAQVIGVSYDDDRRKTEVAYANCWTEYTIVDERGNVTEQGSKKGTEYVKSLTCAYDWYGRLIETAEDADAEPGRTAYRYDEAGRVASQMKTQGGRTVRRSDTYDGFGRRSETVETADGERLTYTYSYTGDPPNRPGGPGRRRRATNRAIPTAC